MTPTQQRVATDQRGAIMVLGVFMAIFLAACLFYVIGVAEAAYFRLQMQDAADGAALASAIQLAKGMNLLVLLNIVMAALLAVLVALRLVVVLSTAVSSICVVLCAVPWTAAAACPVVSPMATLAADVESIYQDVKPLIEAALKGLHGLQVVVRTVTPGFSVVRAVEVSQQAYHPPVSLGVAIPAELTSLPAEDDDFSVLCEHSGAFIGELVHLPFEEIPVMNEIFSLLGDALEALTSTAPTWFCGQGENKQEPPATKHKHEVHYPALASAEACAAAGGDGERAEALCKQAQVDAEAATPDAQTGNCVSRCAPGEPYDELRRKARAQCHPRNGRLGKFSWQERVVVRTELQVDDTTFVTEDLEVVEARMHRNKPLPCTVREQTARDYREVVGELGQLEHPACVLETEERSVGTGRWEVRTREVAEVFGCAEERVITLHPSDGGGLRPESGEGEQSDTSMSPQKVKEGLVMGGPDLQVRSIVLGEQPRGAATTLERLTAGEPSSLLGNLAELGRVAFAQAEFYFDEADADPSQMLWSMRWNARLRRIRLDMETDTQPEDAGTGGDDNGSNNQAQSGSGAPAALPSGASASEVDATGMIEKACGAITVCEDFAGGALDQLLVH